MEKKKQPTLFNYFQRTPAKPVSNGGNNNNNNNNTSPSPSPGEVTKKKSSPITNNSIFKTPKSSSSGTAKSKPDEDSIKKRPKSDESSSKKRLRVSDDEDNGSPLFSTTGEDFSDGDMVWAKMEGYPWWPAMVRGEKLDSPSHRKNGAEFHVQFFDDPPTRAWMRKIDLKPYGGATDGTVPPAKTDRNWIKSCKLGDEALSITSLKQRLKKYWHEFGDDDENEEIDDDEDVQEVENDKNDDSSDEEVKQFLKPSDVTPKIKQEKKRRRIQAIHDSSDDDEDDSVNRNKVVKPSKKSSNTNGISKKGRKSTKDDDEYEPMSVESEDDDEEVEVEDEEMEEDEIEEEEDDDDTSPQTKKNKSGGRKSLKNPDIFKGPKGSTLVSKVVGKMKNNKPYCYSPSPTSTPNTSFSKTPKRGGGGGNATPSTPGTSKKSDGEEKWVHMTLDFLKEGNIKDIHRNPPSHPDYDPKTLYIPNSFLDKCTPAVRQWWEMKSKHYDTILFFKIGKFYELYHMDAVIAVQELSIDFMRGESAHCGFPEIAYSKFSSVLVERGYKVVRVEQTETPDMMQERCKKMGRATKFDRVVNREICQVTTKGVRVSTFQDQGEGFSFKTESQYLFSIIERPAKNGGSDVGVCFIDTTIGKFHIGQFQDDKLFSRLRTIFSHYTPAQVLHEKRKLPVGIQNLLTVMSTVRKDALVPEKEFWNEKTTLKVLNEEKYFYDARLERNILPDNLKELVSKNDHLGLTPEKGHELGIRCFGAVIWYLKQCLLEFDLLSMKDFEIYNPVDALNESFEKSFQSQPETQSTSLALQQNLPKYMVLDGITLKNLDISEGPVNLLSKLDYCSTMFGKRLLRNWVCMPLARPNEISERLDAVEDLMNLPEITKTIIPILKSLPDLERLMSKVHTLGSEHRGKHHPDSRAFFFEETKYSKRKVQDLLSVLKGFKSCVKIIKSFKDPDVVLTSSLLKFIVEDFPALEDLIHYFNNAFDHDKAAKDGKIIPAANVDLEYDSVCQWIQDLKDETNEYLSKIGKDLKCKTVWFGSDKKAFQIEVPENVRVPDSFEMSSSRKGFKRYTTKKTKEFLERTLKADANRDVILKDLMRRVFEKVDSHRDTWRKALTCIANLDVLLCLARYSLCQENMCRPKVVYSPQPFINVEDGRHPCVPQETYIPNSSKLGSGEEDAEEKGVFCLLTGPNMGGKSTLMRQMGLLAVMAQIGCFVPATKCELSVVDRIFTRVGASDNISEGESTFFVEMSETSAILKHSTPYSLVLMDELGRGTATYDGTAIAYSVTRNLVNLGVRCYFSTHYHNLVESVNDLPSIQLGHMACMVENENENDPTQETITFLYKLIPGACPKSYGFNAARLAGLPSEVIRVAHKKARQMEEKTTKIDQFRSILQSQKMFNLNSARAICV